MKKFLLFGVLWAANVFASGPAPSMYADHIARNVGDVLLVQIVENSSATATANTNTKGQYDVSLSGSGSGGLSFIPLFSATGSSSSEHKGTGQTVRQGSVTGTVTVKISEVFPNGNLRIEGQKTVVINGEKQLTILTGVVRPQDITKGNVISSDLIADAQITFKGKGVLANVERPGIFARIYDWLF